MEGGRVGAVPRVPPSPLGALYSQRSCRLPPLFLSRQSRRTRRRPALLHLQLPVPFSPCSGRRRWRVARPPTFHHGLQRPEKMERPSCGCLVCALLHLARERVVVTSIEGGGGHWGRLPFRFGCQAPRVGESLSLSLYISPSLCQRAAADPEVQAAMEKQKMPHLAFPLASCPFSSAHLFTCANSFLSMPARCLMKVQ